MTKETSLGAQEEYETIKALIRVDQSRAPAWIVAVVFGRLNLDNDMSSDEALEHIKDVDRDGALQHQTKLLRDKGTLLWVATLQPEQLRRLASLIKHVKTTGNPTGVPVTAYASSPEAYKLYKEAHKALDRYAKDLDAAVVAYDGFKGTSAPLLANALEKILIAAEDACDLGWFGKARDSVELVSDGSIMGRKHYQCSTCKGTDIRCHIHASTSANHPSLDMGRDDYELRDFVCNACHPLEDSHELY